MAAQYIPIKRVSSLDVPITAEKLDGSLFTTENQAHEFIISVRKNGVKQTVTGGVTGKFIRANGTTIFLQGSISNGDAVVRLHQDCYNVQGRFTFNIFNTQSGVTTCIYSAVGKIDMGSTETVIDAGDVVPDLSDVVAKQEEMTQVIADARAATSAASQAATEGENKFVRFDASQTLTEAQKGTARTNIDSPSNAEITELESALSDNFAVEINLKPAETDGKFVDASNNNVSTSDQFALLGPVPVKKGQTVVFNARGYSTVVGMICVCNSDNTTRSTVVRSVDGTKREYTYKVVEDGYIVLSYVKSDGYDLNLHIDYYSYLNALNQLNPIFSGEETVNIVKLLNGFIDPTTNRFNSSNSFKTSDSITLYKGQTINLTAIGYRTNVGMINLYDENTDTYQSVARSVDDTERLYTYTADTDCVVRVCYLAGTIPSATIVTNEDEFTRIVNIETDISDLKEPIEYPQLFDNILCIGDSLTVGASGNGNEILTKNYPHFLEKLTVADAIVKGHGGYSAKQVWDEYISTANDLDIYDCAIIYLGTNGGLTDTVETDCNADYMQNADTNTGCYGKIIGKIKSDAPNCKIFCVAGANENIRRANTMNPAVRSLTNFYAVGLVDLEESILSDDGSVGSQKRYTYRPIDAIHYNALGYLTLANLIYDGIHDYVSANLIKFA